MFALSYIRNMLTLYFSTIEDHKLTKLVSSRTKKVIACLPSSSSLEEAPTPGQNTKLHEILLLV